MCNRQLQRIVQENTGHSLKFCQKYLRLRNCIQLIVTLNKNNFNDIIYTMGYTDYNHFIKDFKGFPIQIIEKEKGFWRYIIGGTLFGLGWALVGSCPGPIFILLGTGTYAIAVVLIGALLGTYIYGLLKDKLPH